MVETGLPGCTADAPKYAGCGGGGGGDVKKEVVVAGAAAAGGGVGWSFLAAAAAATAAAAGDEEAAAAAAAAACKFAMLLCRKRGTPGKARRLEASLSAAIWRFHLLRRFWNQIFTWK